MKVHRTRGFTLIELIIGLTLISLALTIAFAALRFATRSLERTEHLVNELEELRIVRSVVGTRLAQARPLREEAADPAIHFVGENQQIEFIAPTPTQHDRLAGLYRYRLYLVARGEEQSLALDYESYQPGPARPWSIEHESVILMNNISMGEFSFYGAIAEKGEGWQSQWSGADRLPRMVRIVLRRGSSAEEVEELVVALPTERMR